jgi:ABC-type transport system involved in multi-copper enzyme maturation permease subunit
MSIYGAGYRALQYVPMPAWRRLWSVARLEYTVLFKRRLGIVMFILCLLPALFNLGVMLVQVGVMRIGAGEEHLVEMRAEFPRMDPAAMDFFLTPLNEPPSFLVFVLLTGLVSCRAIAKDRESRALEIYWTRCITPLGYFAAKWFGSLLLLGTIIVAAPALVWVLAVLLAPDWSYLEQTIGMVPRVLGALAVFTAAMTAIAVMFSAVATTANLASILWFSLLIGTGAVGRVLAQVFPGEWWLKAINPWDAVKRVAEWLAGHTPREDYPVGYGLVFSGAVIALLAAWTARRIRRAE